MESFEIFPSTRVVFGDGVIRQLGVLAKDLGAKHVLLVTDPGIEKSGIAAQAKKSMRSLDVCTFNEVQENPTTGNVDSGVAFAREIGKVDLIVGLGGGSAMDCAKGINFVLTNGGKIEDYWGMGKARKPMLPSIGIPTTAGTGSEAQSYALITQMKSHRKMACGDLKARFRTVLLDPVLIQSTPTSVIAATGLDAISHAVESYVSSKRNPISQMYAKEAWARLNPHFISYLENPRKGKARGDMLLGAHLAGVAIECSMLGAAHACANPLTANYHIPHGIAVGMILPEVIDFNAKLPEDPYQGLVEDVKGLADRISELQSVAELPDRLEPFGVGRADLSFLAEEATREWTGSFNPRTVEKQDFLGFYEAVF